MKLYHYTKKRYLPSIVEHGLVPGKSKSLYTPVMTDRNYVWLEAKLYKLRKNTETAIVGIDPNLLDKSKLERIKWKEHIWYRYKGNIPPEAIYIADFEGGQNY